MPKLKNVTAAEVETLCHDAESVGSLAAHLHQRLTQGYSDTLELPLNAASSLLGASRTLADVAHVLLWKAATQEQAAELEKRLRRETRT